MKPYELIAGPLEEETLLDFQALLLAAQRGHKDAVRALLGAGADDLPRKATPGSKS